MRGFFGELRHRICGQPGGGFQTFMPGGLRYRSRGDGGGVAIDKFSTRNVALRHTRRVDLLVVGLALAGAAMALSYFTQLRLYNETSAATWWGRMNVLNAASIFSFVSANHL
ncbi:hypothetical protein [Paraburkholderia sp. JHI869]|uniref:hypothetical protein n=1 Tax=Paraburkholderia sp. JHI869 TaxID=3112959 RepID=UPI0031755CF8